ncbi:MAG: KaiC/GvpD/RAD55 family RecA-like ATPase [Methanobacteriota archaeon]
MPTLDSVFRGGVPSGTSILLSGEVGAGANEFVYTSTAMVSMARTDPETFRIYTDTEVEPDAVPDEVHYVSFMRTRNDVLDEMRSVLDDAMYESLSSNIVFEDFSDEYFRNTVVPRSWVDEELSDLRSLGEAKDDSLLSAFADYLDEKASDSIVVIDSLTSLVRASRYRLDWGEILVMLAGLQRATQRWDGLIYAVLDKDTLEPREHQEIASIFDGIFHFDWVEGDTERQRMMYVGSFRGAMGRMTGQEDDKYETEITEEGFEISNIRKIK